MKKFSFSIAMVFISLAFSFALELESQNAKLVIYEKSGRFNLFLKEKANPQKSYSFFVKEDPKTTMLQILLDNTIYTMGESPNTIQTVEKTAKGAKFNWKLSKIKVSQEFILLGPADSPLKEGLKIIITIENTSEAKHLIGMRYIFDTYLGEKSGNHFITDTNVAIVKEAVFTAANSLNFWISPYIGSSAGEGLLMLTDPNYVTRPDKIVFANWKRLYETPWEYSKTNLRDFNYYPYSFNDSAVCHYYNPISLNKKEKREIVLLLGNSASYQAEKARYLSEKIKQSEDQIAEVDKDKLKDLQRPSLKQFSNEETLAELNKELNPEFNTFLGNVTKSLNQTNYYFVRDQLKILDNFIQMITQKLKEVGKITAQDLQEWRKLVEQFEKNALTN